MGGVHLIDGGTYEPPRWIIKGREGDDLIPSSSIIQINDNAGSSRRSDDCGFSCSTADAHGRDV